MDDVKLGAESGDLRPCLDGKSHEMNVSVSEGQQQPLAYTRPKTTYATKPKHPIGHTRQRVVETKPDDALFTTKLPRITTPEPTLGVGFLHLLSNADLLCC
jgi:hypothetical protein